MPFNSKVKAQAMVACGRCCSICHKFCGIKIECHHIIHESEGGEDTYENCLPLCFDCHADMRSYDKKHPKGTKYKREELELHREQWFNKVSNSSVSTYTDEHRQLDIELFQRITEILPWNTSIDFLRTNNFAGFSFDWDYMSDLESFLRTTTDPSFEFIDVKLEVVRATLESYADELTTALCQNTFSVADGNRSSVPQEWELECPERFNRATNLIHSTAKKVVAQYDLLIKEGRRQLGVSTSTHTNQA